MRDTANAAKVGALVLLAIAVTYGVFRLVDERTDARDGYNVHVLFDDATGLVPKSRVVIAGIQVGYIDKIRLVGNRARVDIRISSDVPIYESGSVEKKSASILGENVLAINPGNLKHPRVQDGAELRASQGAPGMDDILATVGRITASIERVAAQVERAFGTDEGGQQMQSALKNLTEALESVNRTVQTNEAVVGSTLRNVEQITSTSGPQIRDILGNVEAATEDVRQLLEQNRGSLNTGAGTVGDTLASINRASHELEEVMENVHDVTDRTARGEGTLGRLTADETLIDEVEGIAAGFNDVFGGIARLQTIVQLRADYNFVANTFKSYVQLRLQPREDRYYYLEFINDPRGLTTYEQTTVTTSPTPSDRPSSYVERRVRTTDAFRFSFGLAKRLYFATFRFGIIESTGGVGLDLHFFDNAVEVNTDIFAFGEGAYPRLRTNASIEIVSRLRVLVGVDDILNEGSRDYYFGAMLRFNDDDLKAILPFAGGAVSGGGR